MSANLTVLPYALSGNREQGRSEGKYIAIVDDEESVCRAFARLLRAYSFDPQTYLSGDAFLDSLSNRMPACLIVDVQLGDMNGFEVLRSISAMGINIPAIILTARDEPAIRREFELCAATALIKKPVDVKSLLNALGTAMSPMGDRGAERWS